MQRWSLAIAVFLCMATAQAAERSIEELWQIVERQQAQIESLTVSWMKTENLASTLKDIAAGGWLITMQRIWPAGKDPRKRLESPAIHRCCALCA